MTSIPGYYIGGTVELIYAQPIPGTDLGFGSQLGNQPPKVSDETILEKALRLFFAPSDPNVPPALKLLDDPQGVTPQVWYI